ncbi:hypothetical protein WUBG_07484, partial [Wuchereria bancrofti]
KKSFDQFTLVSVLEPTAKRFRLSNPLIGITYGSLQVEKPLIRSTNFIMAREINLASSYEEISQFEEKKPSNDVPMICSADRRSNDHIKALTTDNVETSGFANLGNTCYMNSILQGLFANVIFAKDLFKFCKMVEKLGLDLDEEMPLCLAVANLASQRHCASNSLKMALLEMIKDMSNLDFWSGEQQDAQEFLANILNMMQEECDKILYEQHNIDDQKERNKLNPITANFAFVIESMIRCRRCLIMFVKRYSFNTSAAIKRDDEIRIPLHITLNQGLVSEPELFPPLSPTTRY